MKYIKRWLMLRGAGITKYVPPQHLADYSDMWTHLFESLVRQVKGTGEVWCKGPNCDVHFDCSNLIRRHRMKFSEFDEFKPDIIWQRGSYSDYRPILTRNPKAIIIYYGAGSSWCPPVNSQFDMILVDCKAQLDVVGKLHPDTVCKLLIKPAVETIYKPLKLRKQYDLVFVCNRPREFKGAKWLASRLPDKTHVLRIGPPDKWFEYEAKSGRLQVKFVGKLAPKDVASEACKAKIGAVVDNGKSDSGPRILPEFLAMNIPVLVRNCVRVDQDRYVNSWTGLSVNNKNFLVRFSHLLNSWESYKPREWYDAHIATDKAAGKLLKQIHNYMKAKR